MTWISSGFCLDKNNHGHLYTNANHYTPSVLLEKDQISESVLHWHELGKLRMYHQWNPQHKTSSLWISWLLHCGVFLLKRGFLHLSGSDSGHSL